MAIKVKICGLSSAGHVRDALKAKADWLGFVFHKASPRHVEIPASTALAKLVPDFVKKVAVTVEAEDACLTSLVHALRPDLLQLHGEETLERVLEVKRLFSLPVIKAFSLADKHDIARAQKYAPFVDYLLFDAVSPKAHGGTGKVFDWSLLHAVQFDCPWILSGGLTSCNVERAIKSTGAQFVDVSSGVETSPGHKDGNLMAQFITKAHHAGMV